jgi:hypothetical protein
MPIISVGYIVPTCALYADDECGRDELMEEFTC